MNACYLLFLLIWVDWAHTGSKDGSNQTSEETVVAVTSDPLYSAELELEDEVDVIVALEVVSAKDAAIFSQFPSLLGR